MRIIALLISLTLIAFLFYQYTTRSLRPNENIGIQEGDTILDAVNYAKDATKESELQSCLRLCAIDLENTEDCQAGCNEKYKSHP